MFEENEMFEQFSSKFAAYFNQYYTGKLKNNRKYNEIEKTRLIKQHALHKRVCKK